MPVSTTFYSEEEQRSNCGHVDGVACSVVGSVAVPITLGGISIAPTTNNRPPIHPNTNSPSEWIDSNTCEAFLAPWRRVPHWNPETCAEAGVAADATAAVSISGQ